jgi:probable rRNA maturation factor
LKNKLRIFLKNRCRRQFPLSDSKLKRLVNRAEFVFDENLNSKRLGALVAPLPEMEFSLLLCGDRFMQKLNHEYRSKNKVTDVLSFPTLPSLRVNSQGNAKALIKKMEHLSLGDVVICLPQCQRQAEAERESFENEFIDLLCHGFLHLLGYDHEIGPSEHELMFKYQDKLWKQVAAD